MSELRDRIAAAIARRGKTCGCNPCEPCRRSLADAVIAELNLAKACEGGCVWQIPNRFQDMTDKQKQLLKPRLVADRDCTPLELPAADWEANDE